VFLDRFNGQVDYFSDAGRSVGRRTWRTNFVPDVRSFTLEDFSTRGYVSTNILLAMSANTMGSHISEFGVGTYKKAHRHGAGAHVVVVDGAGYSLMWPSGGQPQRFNWTDGSMISPPDDWWHQHFNTGPKPARYFALRWNSAEFPSRSHWMTDMWETGGTEQIEYEDEDPRIRAEFEAELARHGVQSRLPALSRS
jgi:oxalate decarboxylase/phosphoglucose isomerase-like protein (cupin superfamily)